MKILLIEDDREAATYLIQALDEAGHVTHHASDGETGYAMASSMDYDVLIVDRMLPRRDGLSIVESLRAEANKTPVLILSALGEVDDRVEGLRKGGDDYLSKPFSLQELVARVEALERRRSRGPATEHLSVAGLEMDLLRREVKVRDHEVRLTTREIQILEMLMRNAGRVVTRSMLLEKVWDYRFDPQTNIVDQHVSRLRQKLGDDAAANPIETVRGVGYRIRA